MDDCKYFYLIIFDEVDDSVLALKHLSYLINLIFRHHAAGAGEGGNLLGASDEALDDFLSITRRSPRQIVSDALKLAQRRVCPKDSHCFGNPNLARTSSALVSRPARLSSRPASMA